MEYLAITIIAIILAIFIVAFAADKTLPVQYKGLMAFSWVLLTGWILFTTQSISSQGVLVYLSMTLMVVVCHAPKFNNKEVSS